MSNTNDTHHTPSNPNAHLTDGIIAEKFSRKMNDAEWCHAVFTEMRRTGADFSIPSHLANAAKRWVDEAPYGSYTKQSVQIHISDSTKAALGLDEKSLKSATLDTMSKGGITIL